MNKTFVAICPNYFGKSEESMEAAIAQAKKAGGSRYRKEQFTVWLIDAPIDKISVSDIDGGVTYPKGATVEKLQTSTLAKK